MLYIYECNLLFDDPSEPIEPPPKTYTTRDMFEYFKPCVQVELDNNDKWDTVAEIYVRGLLSSQHNNFIIDLSSFFSLCLNFLFIRNLMLGF